MAAAVNMSQDKRMLAELAYPRFPETEYQLDNTADWSDIENSEAQKTKNSF